MRNTDSCSTYRRLGARVSVAVHGFQVSVFPAGSGIQEEEWRRFQTCKHPIGSKLQFADREREESGDD